MAVYHRKHLELNYTMMTTTFRSHPTELSHKHKVVCLKCSNYPKNRKTMPYFQTKQFVTALGLVSHGRGELEYSKYPVFNTKDTIDLKTCREINF